MALLGVNHTEFGRFRDAYPQDGALVVYTRCGGGNRSEHQSVFDQMAGHLLFLEAVDDPFDTTYCSFRFRFPEKGRDTLPERFLVEVQRVVPRVNGDREALGWAVVEKFKQLPSEPPSEVKWNRVLEELRAETRS